MGIPSFYRYLTMKFPGIVSDMTRLSSEPVHNLYLDLNGVIHNNVNGEDGRQLTEPVWMAKVAAYIDRIVSLVKPTKLVYLALDGVAPRAKMNQQRSRRFLSAREKLQKMAATATLDRDDSFDSNQITPGTSFMQRLGELLEIYVTQRLERWPGINVILSSSSSPGEGEHKIISFIRHLHLQPGARFSHSGNSSTSALSLLLNSSFFYQNSIQTLATQCTEGMQISFCLHTLLLVRNHRHRVFLALSLHEPNFLIVRESPQKSRHARDSRAKVCHKCGIRGHVSSTCRNSAVSQMEEKSVPLGDKDEQKEASSLALPQSSFVPFEAVDVRMLRFYLHHDLCLQEGNAALVQVPNDRQSDGNVSLTLEFEQALDDWIFLTFFAGNDFIPHLPSVDIFEGSFENIVFLYKHMRKSGKLDGPILTKGIPNTNRVLALLDAIGQLEGNTLKTRINIMAQDCINNGNEVNSATDSDKALTNDDNPVDPGTPANEGGASNNISREITAAQQNGVEWMLAYMGDGTQNPANYYREKFGFSNILESVSKVCLDYLQALNWVAYYYWNGVASWGYYYPYHFAPFASSFASCPQKGLHDLPSFEHANVERVGSPLPPLLQLMAVLSTTSAKKYLPPALSSLTSTGSLLGDLYPEDFVTDLNGAAQAWKAVVLLPFIDIDRLNKAVEPKLSLLTDVEKNRNRFQNDLFFHSHSGQQNFSELDLFFLSSYLVGKNSTDKSPETSKAVSFRLPFITPPLPPRKLGLLPGVRLAFSKPSEHFWGRYLQGRNSVWRFGAAPKSNASLLESSPVAMELLAARILNQVEYYFGDKNYPRDSFLQKAALLNNGWIELKTIESFKQVLALSSNHDFIVKALRGSQSPSGGLPPLLVVNAEGTMVCRNPLRPLPKKSSSSSASPATFAPPSLSTSSFATHLPRPPFFDAPDCINLMTFAIEDQISCLNVASSVGANETVQMLLGAKAYDTFFESDVDEQILISVHFACPVLPRRVVIFVRRGGRTEEKKGDDSASSESDFRPATVKLFCNQSRAFDFSDVESITPVVHVELTADEYQLDDTEAFTAAKVEFPVSANKVTSMAIFVQTNIGGGDKSRISSLGIFGKAASRMASLTAK